MNIRELILTHLSATVEGHSPMPFPNPALDDMRLEDFWLDSVAFTNLFVAIEEDVNFIPDDILKGWRFHKRSVNWLECMKQNYESEFRHS